LAARKFLGGQIETTKEYGIFLAVLENSQGNIYFLNVGETRQGI
jgi:hypothetical protein